MKLSAKIYFFCWLVFCFNCQNLKLKVEKESENLGSAVTKVIEDSLMFRLRSLNIISSTINLQEFRNKLLKKLFERSKIIVRLGDWENLKKIRSKNPNPFRVVVFIIESFAEFQGIYPKITRDIFRLNKHFLIVVTQKSFSESKKVFELL
jgi:hypothetical protein